MKSFTMKVAMYALVSASARISKGQGYRRLLEEKGGEQF
jgi:hypothetical protein